VSAHPKSSARIRIKFFAGLAQHVAKLKKKGEVGIVS
jgi:hypothetical protein